MGQDRAQISVIIPALNEQGNIGRLVAETYASLPAALIKEVIVVDDGSADGTANEVNALKSLHPSLRCIRHASRSGQSAAMRTGILAASAGVVATMDGDGQNDPRDLLALYQRLTSGSDEPVGLVGGWRINRKAEGSKLFASRFANWFRAGMLRDNCPDTGCGIKVYDRETYLLLPFFHGQHRYLPALFQVYGHQTAFLAVKDRVRIAGQSNYTNVGRALMGIYDMIGVRWLILRTRAPKILGVSTADNAQTGEIWQREVA